MVVRVVGQNHGVVVRIDDARRQTVGVVVCGGGVQQRVLDHRLHRHAAAEGVGIGCNLPERVGYFCRQAVSCLIFVLRNITDWVGYLFHQTVGYVGGAVIFVGRYSAEGVDDLRDLVRAGRKLVGGGAVRGGVLAYVQVAVEPPGGLRTVGRGHGRLRHIAAGVGVVEGVYSSVGMGLSCHPVVRVVDVWSL